MNNDPRETNQNGELKILLEEQYEVNSGIKSKGENLITILKDLGRIRNVKRSYVDKAGGRGDLSITCLLELKELPSIMEIFLAEIKLYRDLQDRLISVIAKLEKKHSTKDLFEDVNFFTNYQKENISIEQLKKMTNAAYFLKEIFGLIEINEGITREDIISSKKSKKIIKTKAIIAYLLRYKFGLNFSIIASALGQKESNIKLLFVRFKKEKNISFYQKENDPWALYSHVTKQHLNQV